MTTIEELVSLYRNSSDFHSLKANTKRQYNWQLNPIIEQFGALDIENVSRRDFLNYRDNMRETPINANTRTRVFKTLLNWAIDREYLTTNPLQRVKKLKGTGGGHKRWTPADIDNWLANSRGTPRKMFLIAYRTGQRRGDIIRMKWADIQAGFLHLTQEKTGAILTIPFPPDLYDELKGMMKVESDYLVHIRNGRPYSDEGIKAMWARESARLGTEGLSILHGLRATIACELAEAGASPTEIASITGHKTLEMVSHYTRDVDQKRLATSAMARLKK